MGRGITKAVTKFFFNREFHKTIYNFVIYHLPFYIRECNRRTF